MEVTDRFVLKDLPDNTWSVSWPGYEMVVVDNPTKAQNLLKILFDEVKVTEVVLGCHEYNKPDNFETMYIDLRAWCQDSQALAKYVVDCHVITGCKFDKEEDARKFKLIMDQRLAWRRLSGKSWA